MEWVNRKVGNNLGDSPPTGRSPRGGAFRGPPPGGERSTRRLGPGLAAALSFPIGEPAEEIGKLFRG